LFGQSAMARPLSYLDRVDVGVLTAAIPAEVVDEVIDRAGRREQRHRRLPARVVVYFVLGMCLLSAADRFCPPGYRAVIKTLAGRWRGVLCGAAHVSSSALTQARRRLGAKPLQMLFELFCGPVAGPPQPWSHAFGRRVLAWDGTTLAVPDSLDNAAAFGYHGHRAGGGQNTAQTPTELTRGGAATGANPLVRLMMLVECGSHAIIDAAFDGVAQASETALSRALLARLTPGTLLLADRNFLSYPLWNAALATGADLLWRAKSNIYLVPTKHLPDGSYLAILPTQTESKRLGSRRHHGHNEIPRDGHLVRVVEFTITIHTDTSHPRTEHYRLVTTLLDHDEAPAADIAALYHQRWEAENSTSQLKPRLIGADVTLRSRTPEGITQEIYAFLTIYQALTTLRVQAATTARLDPDRISFLITIRAVRADLTDRSTRRPATRRRTLLTEMINDHLGPRRPRTSPRQRIPQTTKYTNKRRDRPQPSTKIRIEITITEPPDP
jgi:Insertion element 4 transposase N-terminal/Transposase DDE domain